MTLLTAKKRSEAEDQFLHQGTPFGRLDDVPILYLVSCVFLN